MSQPKFEFFDDCEVCKAQKKALEEGRNIGQEELLAAFRRQEQIQKEIGVGKVWIAGEDPEEEQFS